MSDADDAKDAACYELVSRRLDDLREVTKAPLARCIGMLDSEFREDFERRKRALDRLFDEVSRGER